MRRTFFLKTVFQKNYTSTNIEFMVLDEASKQLLESKNIKIKTINIYNNLVLNKKPFYVKEIIIYLNKSFK